VVIYLTDSDSDDEPEEPGVPPAQFDQAVEELALFAQALGAIPPAVWNLQPSANPNELEPPPAPVIPALEELPPRLFAQPEPTGPGESAVSDDTFAAAMVSPGTHTYWIERKCSPKRRCYCLSGTSAQSSAEE
jgi:hypothetical protein